MDILRVVYRFSEFRLIKKKIKKNKNKNKSDQRHNTPPSLLSLI